LDGFARGFATCANVTRTFDGVASFCAAFGFGVALEPRLSERAVVRHAIVKVQAGQPCFVFRLIHRVHHDKLPSFSSLPFWALPFPLRALPFFVLACPLGALPHYRALPGFAG